MENEKTKEDYNGTYSKIENVFGSEPIEQHAMIEAVLQYRS